MCCLWGVCVEEEAGHVQVAEDGVQGVAGGLHHLQAGVPHRAGHATSFVQQQSVRSNGM